MASPDLGAVIAGELGFGHCEHVAIVGAGGKTTVLLSLGRHLTAAGRRVLLTTTTKVAAAEVAGVPFLASRQVGDKLVGIQPSVADAAFASGEYDAVLVEADGARHMAVKAPAPHEPIIPASATWVVAVMAADALDRVIEDVAFRPLRVAAAAGCSPYDRLTPERAAWLLTSDLGGRRGVPPGASFAVVLSRVTLADEPAAALLASLLGEASVPCVRLPFRP